MSKENTSKKKIWIFIGNMGSGKSEIAINFTAQKMKEAPERPIRLIDMDIIKPYIRLRDREKEITDLGINLILPDKEVRHMDMPIVPSHIYDHIRSDDFDLVIDVGGEENGCTTIAQFNDIMKETDLEVFLVVNTMRPFSNTKERILRTLHSLEKHSHLLVSGFISNTHLRFDSSQDAVLSGLKLLESVSEETSIPISMVAVWHKILTPELQNEIAYPILPIRLFLTFPWEKGSAKGL